MNPVVFQTTCRLLIIFDNDEGKSDKRNDGRRRTERNEEKRKRLHPLPRIRGRERERAASNTNHTRVRFFVSSHL